MLNVKRLVRSAVLLRRRRTSAETPSQRASRVSGARASFLAVAVLASSFAIANPAGSHPGDHASDPGDPPHDDLSCGDLNMLHGMPTQTYIVDRGVRFVLSDPNDSTVGPGSNGQYGPGEKVRIEVRYNYHVSFDTRDDLWPRIQAAIDGGNVTLGTNEVLPTGLEPLSVLFMMGNQMRPAVSVPASGNDRTTLVFEYEVPQGSSSVNGGDVFIPPNSLVANDYSQNNREGFPAALKSLVGVSLQSISGPCGGAVVDHPPVFHPNEAGSPTIVSKPKILSEPANRDTYYLGEQIVLRVEFSEAVTVTGRPELTFNLGDSTRRAQYDAATSSETRLRFNYTVVSNDTTDVNNDGMDTDANGENHEGISVSRGSLSGGTIRAAAVNGRSATLNHYGLDVQVEFRAREGGDPTVAKHLVNGVADTTDYEESLDPAHVLSYSTRIVSEPANGDTYFTGEMIIVRVDFNESVIVTDDPNEWPSLTIQFRLEDTDPTEEAQARYLSGSGSTRLRFKYMVKTGDTDADGVIVPVGRFRDKDGADLPDETVREPTSIMWAADGGTIYFHFTDVFVKPQPKHKVDGINVDGDPEVTDLPRIVSEPNDDERVGDDYTYKADDIIQIAIDFTQGVQVDTTSGTPQITIRVGNEDRIATYTGGIPIDPLKPLVFAESTLIFSYTVDDYDDDSNKNADNDSNGVSVPAGSIDLNGGSMVAFDDKVDPGVENPNWLMFSALADDASHKVDTDPPAFSTFYIAGGPPSGGDTYGEGQIIEIAAMFDEPVTASSNSNVLLSLDNSVIQTAYLPTDYDDTTANLTVIFEYEVRSGDLDTDGVSLADNALSGTFTDIAGNETSSFGDDDTDDDLRRLQPQGRHRCSPDLGTRSRRCSRSKGHFDSTRRRRGLPARRNHHGHRDL